MRQHGNRKTTPVTDLKVARSIFEDGLTYKAAKLLYGIKSTETVYRIVRRVKKSFPEFVEFTTQLSDQTALQRIEPDVDHDLILKDKDGTKSVTAHANNSEVSLADQIEQTIRNLMNMPVEVIYKMKPEHRLRYVESLTKTMRLLREESTENVKRLSLVKAVGIATARCTPANAGRDSQTDFDMAD